MTPEITKLHSRIGGANRPLAVFVDAGKVLATKIDSALYCDAMRKMPNRLCGVYDHRCHIDWLHGDVVAMGYQG